MANIFGRMSINAKLLREARRADRQTDILVIGNTTEEVRERGRIMKSAGLVKRGGIQQSSVTGDLFQWWGRPFIKTREEKREYWRIKQQEHRFSTTSEM